MFWALLEGFFRSAWMTGVVGAASRDGELHLFGLGMHDVR